jgi:hypothetical protein
MSANHPNITNRSSLVVANKPESEPALVTIEERIRYYVCTWPILPLPLPPESLTGPGVSTRIVNSLLTSPSPRHRRNGRSNVLSWFSGTIWNDALSPRYTVPPKLVDLIRSRGCEIGVHDLNHEGGLYGQLGLG